jgi:hypothetical protein
MAEQNLTKAERRQAAGTQRSKAERKQAKGRRKQSGTSGDGIESRLTRLEEAVASQSQLSEQLLGKLDEVLHEARKSARHAKTAVTQADHDDLPEPDEGF